MGDFLRRHAWPLGILGSALALRLILFTGLQGNDDTIYARTAQRLAQGDWAPHADVFWMRLGYVGPMAILFALFGTHIELLVLPNLAASLGLVGLAYRFGREIYSEKEARLAAIFVAIFPVDIFYATEGHADLPMAALGTLSVYLLWTALRADEKRRGARRAVLAGLTLGVAHLTKEPAFLFVLVWLPWARERRSWPRLGWAAAGFAAVVSAEMLLYSLTLGDPFARVRTARSLQEFHLSGGAEGLGIRLADLIGMLFDPRGSKIPYTGGLFWLVAPAFAWAVARDRAASAWTAFAAGALLLSVALWPRALFPYRPAMILHVRVLAPVTVPAALLAARFVSAAFLTRWPRATLSGASLVALVALFCAVRLHQDGLRLRSGVEWGSRQLRVPEGSVVIADPRTAEMLHFLSGYALPYRVRAYRTTDPIPEPGSQLFDDAYRVQIHQVWDETSPPPWWRGSEPTREVVAQQVRPAPWRLRGSRGAPDRVTISRIAGGP